MNVKTIYYAALAVLATIGTAIAEALGGWDPQLKTLGYLMLADYVTGALCAAVWKRSPKSETGAYESRAGFKGLIRKGAIMLVILIATRLDELTGTNAMRTAAILFFAANEGMSIIENLGIMGVPFPDVIRNAFTVLKQESGSEEVHAAAENEMDDYSPRH